MRIDFIPKDLLITSEDVEPMFVRVIGKFFAQCEHLRETHSAECVFFVDLCGSWWWTMEAMNSLTVGIDSASHAAISIGNELNRVAWYIEKYLGFDPLKVREELKHTSFRNFANGVDMRCIFDESLHLTK